MDEYNYIAMSYGYIVDNQLMIYKGSLSGRSDIVKKIDRHKRIADIEVYLWLSLIHISEPTRPY